MCNAAIADKGQHPECNDWRDGVGLLNRYLAATRLSLPKSREVGSKSSAGEVLPAMLAADAEITGALGQLAEQGAGYCGRSGDAERGGGEV